MYHGHPTRRLRYGRYESAWSIARSLARNTGKFVIDVARRQSTRRATSGCAPPRLLLPKDRVILDDTREGSDRHQKDVIGYASWGSNDSDRKAALPAIPVAAGSHRDRVRFHQRAHFQAAARSMEHRNAGRTTSTWFAGSPQTLTADYIHEGASGASGQVDEPYLTFCPRPDFVLPAYFEGRNLAESFYMGIPGLSWMNVVIGDPLMRLQ